MNGMLSAIRNKRQEMASGLLDDEKPAMRAKGGANLKAIVAGLSGEQKKELMRMLAFEDKKTATDNDGSEIDVEPESDMDFRTAMEDEGSPYQTESEKEEINNAGLTSGDLEELSSGAFMAKDKKPSSLREKVQARINDMKGQM